MKKLTQQQFEDRSNIKHNYWYDYTDSIYTDIFAELTIICPEHGSFQQVAHNHMRGRGCKECGLKKISLYFLLTQQQFEDKSNLVHNSFYDYTDSIYKGNSTPVIIICPKHGSFKQTPHEHMGGCGCNDCGREKTSSSNKVTNDEFIDRSNIKHNFLYGYNFVNIIDVSTEVIIICPKHGSFKQIPSNHMIGQGCPTCKNSKGELEIIRILNIYNVNFEKQKRFSDCRYKKPLPFDFYLTDKNILIEFDGKQHFSDKSYHYRHKNKKYSTLEITQRNDKIKTDYCINKNIELIRIPYTEKNIEEFLLQQLKIM